MKRLLILLSIVLAAPQMASALITPTLTGQASTPALAGGSMTDTATLAAGMAPIGTITFQLFNVADGLIFSSTKAVNGNGPYTSDPFGPLTDSTFYTWQATYSGDANNASVATILFGGAESVAVPEYCPPHACSVPVACTNGTVSATSSTTSCKGLPPRVTVVTVVVVGPASLCYGPEKSLSCSIVAGGVDLNVNTETVVDEIFADDFEGM